MKKIISVIFIASFLFACNSENKEGVTATDTKTTATTEKPPVELIMDSSLLASTQATMAAFQNKDVEGYTANMDDNVKFR